MICGYNYMKVVYSIEDKNQDNVLYIHIGGI